MSEKSDLIAIARHVPCYAADEYAVWLAFNVLEFLHDIPIDTLYDRGWTTPENDGYSVGDAFDVYKKRLESE